MTGNDMISRLGECTAALVCKSFTASRAPEFGGKRRRSGLRCKGRATQGVTNLLHVTGLRFSHHFGSETDCLNSNQKPIQDRLVLSVCYVTIYKIY